MGRIIEGVWDCTYCGTKKIRGSVYKCPECGRQRDDNITFYMDDTKRYLSDEEAKKLNKNPDWLCSFCDALNSDDNEKCYNCGATREESKLNYFENKLKKQKEAERRKLEELGIHHSVDEENGCDNSSGAYDGYDGNDDGRYNGKHRYNGDDIKENDEADGTAVSESTGLHAFGPVRGGPTYNRIKEGKMRLKEPRRGPFHWEWILITLAVLAFTAGLVWLFIPKEVDGTVNGFEWERIITVEEYKTVREDDWSIPSGGRLLYTKQEIRSYRDVFSHYETKTCTYTEQVFSHYEEYVSGYRDLGNGRFEEIVSRRPVYKTETKTETYQEPVYVKEPVYATKYYYEIERWLTKEYCKTSGTDHTPYWGEYSYADNEREGGRSDKYTVHVYVEKKDTIKSYDLSYDEWLSLSVGQTVKLKTYIDGSAELLVGDEET